jgi:hypothetical protein
MGMAKKALPRVQSFLQRTRIHTAGNHRGVCSCSETSLVRTYLCPPRKMCKNLYFSKQHKKNILKRGIFRENLKVLSNGTGGGV